jgi:predicted MFS family arabinose efflux permease
MFRAMWVAVLVSNLGGWMQNVGAAWLMTSLSSSPMLIAVVQAANTFPIFLLALPAGALADVLGSRKLLLADNLLSFISVSVLATLTLTGSVSPVSLLALTFAVGAGTALGGPAFQSSVSEMVPEAEIPSAVSLNSAGFNLARAIGPAVGGLIVAQVGAGANFVLNALSFVGVLVVLFRWRETARKSVLPAERFVGAMRAGARYVLHAPALRTVLVRTAIFIIPGSAIWALLPVLVRELGRGPSVYGILLGALGAGAIVGAALLERLKRWASLNALAVRATVLFGGATAVAAGVRSLALLIVAMVAGGFAWMVLLTSLNVATRMVTARWVQARALSVYLLVFQGGIAIGSLLWGFVAARVGVRVSVAAAGAALLLGVALAKRFSLTAGEALDLAPAGHWPAPEGSPAARSQLRPVLVVVEYEIDPARAAEFTADMKELETIRRRDGALSWGLFSDPAAAGKYREEFLVESWVEHLRQHERVTVSDQRIQERIWALHKGPGVPRATHYLAEERG